MKLSLNHGWSFAPGRVNAALSGPFKSETIALPHTTQLFPTQYINERDFQQEYTYQKTFDLKEDAPVKTLVFDGVMLQFDAFLNGKELGHFVSGFLPIEIDVSDLLRPKGNVLTLFVDGREDPLVPPFGKVVDYLTFAGIYREVWLRLQPKSHIADLFVQANGKGDVRIQPTLVGEGKLTVRLLDDGKEVLSTDKHAFHVDSPRLWTLSDPHLYELEATFGEDVRVVKIGFRDATFTQDGFYLNGKKKKIVGLNRHQSYPYFGMAAPKSLQEEDADLLKETGINLVRTSHYPQSEHFLSRCDEIGLMVIDEIPGWQFIGENKKWRANCKDFAKRMILKERNHPCLVAYGLRIDESPDDDELYHELQTLKNRLDPNRPSIGVRNFKDSHCLEDIYGYNDFSGEDLDHGADPSKQLVGGKGKPKLITESNGHMFPTKSFDPTSRRREHALRHAKTLSDVLTDPGYVGAVTWCAFDYNTHKDFGSDDHICHHGVYDIFRNPKYAASFFQSQRSKGWVLEAASLMEPGDFDAALLPKTAVFTNAEYVALYRGEDYIGRFYPDFEHYPGLPHPPIFVDDIIGELFNEPKISKEDGQKIVQAFNHVAQNGYNKMRLRDKVLLGRMMAKYRLNFSYIYATYAKYVSSWGESTSLWRFDAFAEGKKVASIRRGPSTDFHLEAVPTRETLTHGETYDCVSVHIFKKDQYGTTMPYAFDVVEASVEGPIEIYGPKVFSLYGGGSAIYVRSLPVKAPSEGVLRLNCAGETTEIRFLVRGDESEK